MKQYQVTFAPNTSPDNIQREVINARDEQDARAVYAACDCWVYEVVEVDSEEAAFQAYKAKREAETAESLRQMKEGTFKVRPLYSFKSFPCTMPEDNGRVYEGLE